MEIDNVPNDRQPQSQSAHRTPRRIFLLGEPIENRGEEITADSGSIIADRYFHVQSAAPQMQFDRSSFRAELDGIR